MVTFGRVISRQHSYHNCEAAKEPNPFINIQHRVSIWAEQAVIPTGLDIQMRPKYNTGVYVYGNYTCVYVNYILTIKLIMFSKIRFVKSLKN